MRRHLLQVCGTLLGLVSLCQGTETRNWMQSDYADFQNGVRTNLSIRSDGRLSLAPKTSEVFDSASAYLWALARDSRGNVYTAGGPGAKLFRIAPNGKGEKIADFDALEVHALAVDSEDRVYAATDPDGRVYRIDRDGKSTVFYDPGQKYIWAMLFDTSGNLFIATGDQGEIHKVLLQAKARSSSGAMKRTCVRWLSMRRGISSWDGAGRAGNPYLAVRRRIRHLSDAQA